MLAGKNILFDDLGVYINIERNKRERKTIYRLIDQLLSINKMKVIKIGVYEADINNTKSIDFFIENIPVIFSCVFEERGVSISFRTKGKIREIIESGYNFQCILGDPVFDLIVKEVINKSKNRLKFLTKYGGKPEKIKEFSMDYLFRDVETKFFKLNIKSKRVECIRKFLFWKTPQLYMFR